MTAEAAMTRPVPRPTPLSAEFWSAAAAGKLVIPCCTDCGARFFVPEPACPACLSRRWSYQPSAGTGTVYSVTVVHRAPGPGFEVPYVLAVIDLDDGGTLLSHVVDIAGAEPAKRPEDFAAEVTIGLRVRVDFRELTAEIALPCFVPDNGKATA